MRNELLIILVFVLSGCSMLPPSSKDYQKAMDRELGTSIKGDYMDIDNYYKIQKINRKKYYYYKSYNYSTKAECRVVYITNIQDIIIGYRILTPNTCKIGISPVW